MRNLLHILILLNADLQSFSYYCMLQHKNLQSNGCSYLQVLKPGRAKNVLRTNQLFAQMVVIFEIYKANVFTRYTKKKKTGIIFCI